MSTDRNATGSPGAPFQVPGAESSRDLRHLLTERLELRALSRTDLTDVYRMMSDPRVWEHFPSGVHTSPERTAAQLSREELGWELDNLGYWLVRLREDGTFVGVGGCRLHASVAWNLYHRVRPELQGNGYATEVATAALQAARVTDPELPIVASILAHNLASRAVATAVGLRLEWEGPGLVGTRPAGAGSAGAGSAGAGSAGARLAGAGSAGARLAGARLAGAGSAGARLIFSDRLLDAGVLAAFDAGERGGSSGL